MERQSKWRGAALDDGWRKGPWTAQEDKLLTEHVNFHGEGRWNCVSKSTGLRRDGKSCRLRWVNYLSPDLKRGKITPEEESIILELHALWGNRWSAIARRLPGRTDNEIKNYWRTHFKKSKPSKNAEKARAWQQQQQQERQREKQEEQHRDENMRMMVMLDQVGEQAELAVQEQEILANNYLRPLSYLCTLQGGSTAADGITSISHGCIEECSWGSLWQLDDDVHQT